jgi:hypothetical protein
MLKPSTVDCIETVNDADGFVSNFWRATQHDPEAVAHWSDWPVFENDLHARHIWLRGKRDDITRKLEADPDYYDAKVAGWWVWGQCCWIGGEWCASGRQGPWDIVEIDGERQLVHVGTVGNGVSRRRIDMTVNRGINRQLGHLADAGRGVNRQCTHLSCDNGIQRQTNHDLLAYFAALSTRLRRVRVCCGDWSRLCSPSVTTCHGLTAVFLDPPYSDAATRDNTLYACESNTIAHDVRDWALANGDDPLMRIALCGYEGEYEMPDSWSKLAWKAQGGMANQGNAQGKENARRERIWFSPHCLKPNRTQARLFE